ncbi:MAG: hypothetical protein HFH82_10530 [Lachnospiraceae bacterium]|nr:hypothetical protein [Lachnospiraceae bacterium]
MKKQAILRGVIIGVCGLTLTGCSKKQTEGQGQEDMSVTLQYQNDISDMEDMSLNRDGADDADGNDNKEQSLPNEGASAENLNPTAANDISQKVDAASLYASAAIVGSVIEFSEVGCTVSAVVTEDDGKTGVAAAPGHESEDTNVVVTYQEGCEVQIATIYTSTGTAELEQVSVSDIKKQASVIIYGNFEDTHHISATKIIICHRTA